jgi:hypothetical protein
VGQPVDVQVVNGIAYVVANSGLEAIDVTDATRPRWIGEYSLGWGGGLTTDVEVVGSTAYLISSTTVYVLDVSTPYPSLRGTYQESSSNFWSIHVVGSFAYVAGTGLTILDVSNPASPQRRGRYQQTGQAYDVQVAGETAYLVGGNPGMVVIDVRNPDAPQLRSNVYNVNQGRDIEVSGSFAYVADEYATALKVFNLQTSSTSPTPPSRCSVASSRRPPTG